MGVIYESGKVRINEDKGDLTLGMERVMQCADVLLSCTLKPIWFY